ncbi:MAG TPA: Hsp20/alpha crystallin family protein [Actinomycetota bacterium]|jgi:HSP20 family protein|nr:Hsp20/alpha crystallin family protein [Actinomycetota bacterium]
MFERLERQMDDLVGRMLRRPASASYRRAWAPHVDVYLTEGEFVLVVDLAGVDPSSVTIEVEGEAVSITGRRESTTPPECADYLQLEIPFGEFERTLLLPGPVEAADASANFDEGLLTVRLPKARRGPQKVQVEIQPPD